jgi:RHH-type proline utilization regulon transcriptional repressor/proline dehydrogenase/delta 1-pyrroline-5-carboxylate dehydrogenase
MKRVVAEMGGKNCLFVDSDADLDEAVPATVSSAFGYAGQKCSAVSRVLVHREQREAFARRLGGAVESLEVGRAERFGVDLGPLIEPASAERFDRYLALAGEGEVIAGGGQVPAAGWFRPPTAVTGLEPGSPLATDEVFAPLLLVEEVEDVEEAIAVIDASRFALTAGVFTRNPRTVEAVANRLPVGNLYVNRGTTGAMVGRQPFGGNRLSGTGTKAGGPDYLRSFVEPRVVCENTMRQGLVVD